MGVDHAGPVDQEELVHVELRAVGWRGEGRSPGRGSEPDDGEGSYRRPGRIEREDHSADDLRSLDAPEVRPVGQAADFVLRASGNTAVARRIREPRRDDDAEGR